MKGYDRKLISYMTKLVQRVRRANLEQGVNLNNLEGLQAKKRVGGGQQAPLNANSSHPEQKIDLSDLDDIELADGAGMGGELDISD